MNRYYKAALIVFVLFSVSALNAQSILTWTKYADMSGEWAHAKKALNNQLSNQRNFKITEMNDIFVDGFKEELFKHDIFIVPEFEGSGRDSGINSLKNKYKELFKEFVNQGGTLIVLYDNQNILKDLELMNISFKNYYNSGSLSVTDKDHYLFENIDVSQLKAQDATAYFSVDPTETDAVILLKNSNNAPVVVMKPIGLGQVISFGFDFYEYTTNEEVMLSNLVKYSFISKGKECYLGAIELNLEKKSYTQSEVLNFETLIQSSCETDFQAEIYFWLETPKGTVEPILDSPFNMTLYAKNSVVLPWSFSFDKVTYELGRYVLGMRMLHPHSGSMISEDRVMIQLK